MGRRSVCKFLKARTLVSCILFTILLILLLSTTAQATENREVKAEEILKQIEYGEDVNYTDCHIVGELNTSNITLKTVPNPYYKLVNEGYNKEYFTQNGINENLYVIESNIIIKNSIFKENLNFSNVLFNGSVEFEGTNFSNSANFNGAYFNNSANFVKTNFSNSANFDGTNFNSSANFPYANFDGDTYFKNATFLGLANFSYANFYSSANFSYTNFNSSADFWREEFSGPADFSGAKFHGDTSFWKANFDNDVNFSSAYFKNKYTSFQEANFDSDVNFLSANFSGKTEFKGANFSTITHFCYMTINSSVYFSGPKTSENIITDYKTRSIFVKYYTEEALDEDAENIYYNFRKHEQDNKSPLDYSKWTDSAGKFCWGYGVKPLRTVRVSILVIIFFAFIYMNPRLPTVRRNGKKIIIRLNWGEPGIYRKGENGTKPITSNWEFLYFSVNIFTRLGSADWHQKDSFRRWVTFEAFLGWLLLALLMATTVVLPRIQ